MNRRLIVRGVLAVFAIALLAAGAVWLQPKAVEVVHPRIGPAILAVYASGTVEASVMMPIAPRNGARLVELNVDEGSDVKAGQRLGRLEDTDLRNNIAQLAAQERFAKGDLDRDMALLSANAIARQVYDRALSAWQAAKAAVNTATAQSGFMTLLSPGNCHVIQRDGEIGQFIAPNTPVFWLSCNAPFRVTATVDEEDIALVRVGQKVLIRADAFPGKVFEAQVTSITPKGDAIGRSYRVRIALPQGTPLQIGMTTEANIIIRIDQSALLLPDSAIADNAVWRVVDGRAVRAPVMTGAKSGSWVEIVSGIGRDDVVVRDASAAPANGTKINANLVTPK